MATYVVGLFFSLKTHRDIFNPEYEDEDTWGWSTRTSVIALAIAGVLVGVMSEILVGSITEASHAIGLSEFFIGVIVVAIVGNAAEHWVAVLVATKDKMDLAVNIAIGSSAQVALFVAPVLVLASFFIGPYPLALVFNGFELGAILIAILIAQLRHPGRRVDLVRGRAAARRLLRLRARFLLRLAGTDPPGRIAWRDGRRPPAGQLRGRARRGAAVHQRDRVDRAPARRSARGRSAASSPRSGRRCRRR